MTDPGLRGPSVRRIPEGDNRERMTCAECGFVLYDNPKIDGLLAIYDIPRISQVQLIYRARLVDEAIAAGPESLEVGLFGWDEIPWGEIAFPSVHWALHHEREAQASGDFTTRTAPSVDPAGPQRE
jgi:hypothetical protein